MGKDEYEKLRIDWLSLSGYVRKMEKEANCHFEHNVFIDQEVQNAFMEAMAKSIKYRNRLFKQRLKEIDNRRLKEESDHS